MRRCAPWDLHGGLELLGGAALRLAIAALLDHGLAPLLVIVRERLPWRLHTHPTVHLCLPIG